MYYGVKVETGILADATDFREYISFCILPLFLYLWSFRRIDATLTA